MKKIFCDKCGAEGATYISYNVGDITSYDRYRHVNSDLCEKCKKELIKIVDEFSKGKNVKK